jgi:hypothetical protein
MWTWPPTEHSSNSQPCWICCVKNEWTHLKCSHASVFAWNQQFYAIHKRASNVNIHGQQLSECASTFMPCAHFQTCLIPGLAILCMITFIANTFKLLFSSTYNLGFVVLGPSPQTKSCSTVWVNIKTTMYNTSGLQVFVGIGWILNLWTADTPVWFPLYVVKDTKIIIKTIANYPISVPPCTKQWLDLFNQF